MSDPILSTDTPEALLAQVALGDRAAFETLYHATSDKLFGICLRVLHERGEAEEALQDVFTAVWRKAAQFDPGKAGAISWLGIMARNKAIDRLRALPVRSAHTSLDLAAEVASPGVTPSQHAEILADNRRLARCLEELEPLRRSLIREAFFGGFTYEELAAKMQAPLGSIKSWIRRGLIQLRVCLES